MNTQFITPDPAGVPEQLRVLPHWVCWRLVARRIGKPSKVPIDPITGKSARVNATRTWTDFDVAMTAYERDCHSGIGFVLTYAAGITAVDLDGVRDASHCEVTAPAAAIVKALNTYTEVSPSGTGIHMFGYGQIDPSGPKRKGGIELYSSHRFIAITGYRVPGTPPSLGFCEPALRELQDQLRESPSWKASQPSFNGLSAQSGHGVGFLGGDGDLLRLAFGGRNGGKIRAYWSGDWCGKPSPSEALLGLAQLLVFYTGPDEDRLGGLLMQSPLFASCESLRVKWCSPRPGGTWGPVCVVRKAIVSCNCFYSKGTLPRKEKDTPHCVRVGVQLTPVQTAWNRVLAGEVPPGMNRIQSRQGEEKRRMLAALCWHLARRGVGPFYLSSQDAAILLEVDRSTISRWLSCLVDIGFLKLLRRGSDRTGKASEYLYVDSGECGNAAA